VPRVCLPREPKDGALAPGSRDGVSLAGSRRGVRLPREPDSANLR